MKVPLIIAIVVFSIIIACVYIQCGKEAEFYTRITGIEVSRVDALWLDLDPSKHVVQIEQERK